MYIYVQEMIIRTVVRIMEQFVPWLHSTAIIIDQGDIGIYKLIFQPK